MIVLKKTEHGQIVALISVIAGSMGDEDCRNNRERRGEDERMRERNALPIDYLTHISTSDL